MCSMVPMLTAAHVVSELLPWVCDGQKDDDSVWRIGLAKVMVEIAKCSKNDIFDGENKVPWSTWIERGKVAYGPARHP